MLRPALLPLLFLSCASLEGAEPIRVQGNGYAFLVAEPEGWRISLNSAQQIASFVMHPAATGWREAEVLAFGRFARRQAGETLEGFARSDLEGYQTACPFYESGEGDAEIEASGRFLTRSLHCPGLRHELVAFTQGPGFFATFVLSAGTPRVLQRGLVPFREMLESFAWDETP